MSRKQCSKRFVARDEIRPLFCDGYKACDPTPTHNSNPHDTYLKKQDATPESIPMRPKTVSVDSCRWSCVSQSQRSHRVVMMYVGDSWLRGGSGLQKSKKNKCMKNIKELKKHNKYTRCELKNKILFYNFYIVHSDEFLNLSVSVIQFYLPTERSPENREVS